MIYVIKSQKNTRKHDLEHYEEFRDKYGSWSKSTNKINQIYQQGQNEHLERLRYALIDAHKRGDLNEVERIEKLISSLR